MTYKLNQSLLQKLRDGAAIDNTGNPNPALLKQVLRCAFPDDKAVPDGMCKYYYPNHENKGIWNNTDMPITSALIPLNDFIQKGVVVGYKVKPAFAWCAKKLFSTADPIENWDAPTMVVDSFWYNKAKNAEVLDLWFDVITEEPKEENEEDVKTLYPVLKLDAIVVITTKDVPAFELRNLIEKYNK